MDSLASNVDSEFDNVYDILTILSLKADYNSYLKFRYLLPRIHYENSEKNYKLERKDWEVKPTEDQYYFCLTFLINLLLNLEEAITNSESRERERETKVLKRYLFLLNLSHIPYLHYDRFSINSKRKKRIDIIMMIC